MPSAQKTVATTLLPGWYGPTTPAPPGHLPLPPRLLPPLALPKAPEGDDIHPSSLLTSRMHVLSLPTSGLYFLEVFR